VTEQLAILGAPIGHSRSPQLHRAAYRALGLDWEYGAIEVREQELAGFLDGLDARWRGLSCTMPLKKAIPGLVDESSPLVQLTGVANTILLTDGVRRAYNTDIEGIRRALAAQGVDTLRSVTIFGAGATATSAVIAAHSAGASTAVLVVRDPERAAETAALAEHLGMNVSTQLLGAYDPDSVPDLVVNTVPAAAAGELPHPAELYSSPLFEASYDPWPTAFARRWLDAGGTVIPGIDMLIEQALIQVRIFVTGDPGTEMDDEAAVLTAMRASVGRDPSAPWHP
jgi:shikimate dehydrogenase